MDWCFFYLPDSLLGFSTLTPRKVRSLQRIGPITVVFERAWHKLEGVAGDREWSHCCFCLRYRHGRRLAHSRFLHCSGRVSNDFQTYSHTVSVSRLQLQDSVWPPSPSLNLSQANPPHPQKGNIHTNTNTQTLSLAHPTQALCLFKKLHAFQS